MWRFREMTRGEMNQDPVHDEYFNSAALDSYSDALVREAIQNSLDARLTGCGDKIHVRITFPDESDWPEERDAGPYLNSLWPHIVATDVLDAPKRNGRVPFLLFEDFGTRGLVGDPERFEDPSDDERDDFYWFWRNIGRGKKQGEDRGRWGLGKTMFPASSRIHAFFGLTMRERDEQPLLMGQSTLAIHRIGEKKHSPYGYFAKFANDQFALPINEQARIDDFCSTFSVSRTFESGLSVVVPYPRDEINATDVLKSVAKHYFYPILSRTLVVEILFDDKTVIVDENSIDNVVREYISEEDTTFLGTLELAKWYISIADGKRFRAKDQRVGRSPLWNPELFTDPQIDQLAEQLDSLDPICVRVPVHVIRKGSEARPSYFDVALVRDQKLENAVATFIRAGITITGVSSLREAGIWALVVADDSPISGMLGDAENPAHTEWQERSPNFKGKYRVGPSTLAFVKNAPGGLLRILYKHSELIDDTALRHVFPDQSSGGGRPANGPAPNPTSRRRRRQRTNVDVESRPRIFVLSRSAGGFKASLTDNGREKVPLRVMIRLAYNVRRGNPYRRWNAADFDLGSMDKQVTLHGGEFIEIAGNRMEVHVTSSEWELRISGFDTDRDLIVDIRREAG